MYIPQLMPLFQISHVYEGIEIPFFCQRRRVYAGTVNISCLFGCKPKKGVELMSCKPTVTTILNSMYKMVVTVGLHDISSMYITQFYVHNSGNLCFHFICLLFKI